MAPQSSYGGYGSYGDPWKQDVPFSLNEVGEPRALYIAGFAFDVLTVIALVGFMTWACLIPNARGCLKGVVIFIATWLVSAILMVVYECFFLANATVEQYYLILWMISTFFSFASNCVGYFVFYNLIHGLLGRLTDAGNPYRPIAIMHWIVVGIVSAFSLACWGMYVAVQDFSVMSPNFHFFGVYRYVQSALEIVYWLVSIEVLAWTIFIAVKAGSYRFNTKTPAIALIFASIFWLGNNLEWAVIQILYIIKGNFTPVYLGLVVSVTQFLFVIGIFVGILVCCNSWSRLDDAYEKPAAMMQQPYGTAPSNGQYQVYQPYQAQAPQMLQPYPQQPQEQH